MRYLIFVLLFFVAGLSSTLQHRWSNNFIGSIKQIRLVNINGDQANEIIVGGKSGIVAINSNGTIAWNKNIGRVDKLLSTQYDNDNYSELIATGWLDINILDNNGSQLTSANFSLNSTERLPVVLLGDKIVTYSADYNGLVFFDSPGNPFYYISNISKNALASVDITNDGKNDLLFGVSDSKFFRINENGAEDWNKTLSFNNSIYVWAGKLQNSSPVVLLGTTDGAIHAFDINGSEKWTQKVSNTTVKKIKKDKNGGFLILTNNDSIWSNGTQNTITKIYENNGSIEWQKMSGSVITKALTQSESKIAVGFGSGFKIFNEDGDILNETNISEPSYGKTLDVQSLHFGKFTNKKGLFVGSLDIDFFSDNIHKKIYAGGTLVNGIVSGDMNSDGIDEIAVQDENRLYLYDSNGSRIWTKNHYILLKSRLKDLTGDGKKELITGYNGKIVILDYNGTEVWSKPNAYYSNIYPIIKLYDYDGDGLPDIFISHLVSETQKYSVEVWSGKNGSLLHNFGAREYITQIKPIKIEGFKKLFYSNYETVYSVDFNKTLGERKNESIPVSDNNKLNIWKDINGDEIPELFTAYDTDNGTSVIIIDFTKKDEYDQYKRKNISLPIQSSIKKIKLFDYNKDGVYELLTVFPEGVYLYDLNGTKIWEKKILDQYGGNRTLSDIKVVGGMIIVSGKEIYILNNNGVLLQTLQSSSYMSGADYYLPTTLARISDTELQLVFGGMGVYSYTGLNSDVSHPQSLSYKAGWNLVATPTSQTISLESINGLNIAWTYIDNHWVVHTTNPSDTAIANNLNYTQFSTIVPMQGVWIKTSSSGELKFSGIENSIPALHRGWNLVGGIDTTPDRLHNNNQKIDIIWKYTNQDEWQGKSYIVDAPLDTLMNISASEGFWVHVRD